MDLEFGNYRLGRAERLLLGPKGPVELSARSFDILTILLERPDEVIGKTELFDAVWPGLVVEENTLQVHVSALRKALDTGMIVTVHGRGYKYAARGQSWHRLQKVRANRRARRQASSFLHRRPSHPSQCYPLST